MKLHMQSLKCLECLLWPDQPMRLERAAGVCVVCLHGTVWLTLTGSRADVFLLTGQSTTIGSNKLALLEAIGAEGAGIRILPARNARVPAYINTMSYCSCE